MNQIEHEFNESGECIHCQASGMVTPWSCPKQPLTAHQRQQLYFGELDYDGEKWVTFPPKDNGEYT
jgi:hypothetical protein